MRGNHWFYIIMLVIVMVVASIGYNLVDNNKERYLTELQRDLSENNRQYSELVKSEINNTIVLVGNIGELLDFTKDLDLVELSNVFKNIDENTNIVSNIYYTYDSNGSSVDYSGYLNIKDLGFDLRERHWYSNAVQSKELIVTDVYSDLTSNKPVITIAYPVYEDSKLQGVLSVDMFLKDIHRKLQYITKWGNTYSYILDRKGTVILHPDKKHLGLSYANTTDEQLKELDLTKEYFNSNILRIWNNSFSKSDKGNVNYLNFNFIKVHAVFEHMTELGWTIVSACDYSEIANDIFGYGLLVAFLSVLVIAAFAVVFYYFYVWADSRDPVTRTFSIKKMKDVIRKRQNEDESFTILYIDLRYLSFINNRYGMKNGDKVLLQYSKILQSLAKKHGILGTTKKKNFIFVFNDKDWDNAVDFTTMLDKRLAKLPLELDNNILLIDSFIGLTTLTLDGKRDLVQELESVEELFVEFKKTGTESPLLYYDFNKLVERKKTKIKLKNQLLMAIEEDRIVPFFQPIYNIKSGMAVKFEVLMRIKEGDKYLSPFPYIQLAEKYNMIDTVDSIVIFKALEYMAIVYKNDEVELSINVSGKVLHDYKFMNKIVEKIDKLNIRHSNITFEITETQDALDSSKTIYVINHYKKLGFKFSIDDFGTGFSSMYSLKHIPADYVKIDGSFIKDIKMKNESYYVVESIISMAKAFNIKTVAEFVENQEINEILKQMGVDYGQGYFFGKPEEHFNFHE